MREKTIKLPNHVNPLILLIGVLTFLFLQGCTCCAYFNHAWNMENAYEQAGDLREARLDSIPGDSILSTGKERGLYDRVIEKGSRIVERFPKNETQVPKAVFMMAESFRNKNEWAKAIEKYDELERYFPQYDSMPKAEYQRAFCLYKNAEYALSRFSAQRIIEDGEKHEYYLPAMGLMSLLQEKEGLPEDAIASLEAVLATSYGSPWMRARARIRLADLYYEQKIYDKAREHYVHKELSILPVTDRYKAQSTAAECLVLISLDNGLVASNEYKALADSADFSDKKILSLLRQGEILLSINDVRGVDVLRDIAYTRRKGDNTARAYFGIGDFRQRGREYLAAISLYDSSFQSMPRSDWGIESNNRKVALLKLLALKDTVEARQKEQKPFFPMEFQIAELFLLKLSEADSALALLARMDSTLEDSLLRARATYTRAFIYDEFKRDTSKSYPLYRKVIENFPQTNFAKQAQANMGLPVNIKTKDDFAKDLFLKAEEAWLNTQKIPIENMEEIETAYQKTIALYDSVIIKFPQTQFALQARYVKAGIYSEEIGIADSARVLWSGLVKEHPATIWGKAAQEKLRGKLSVDINELLRLRGRVEQTIISTKQLSDKYWQEMEERKNAPPPQPKEVDDEILRNDYNTLYDFK